MIDDGVGEILAALKAQGLSDNTIVIFTSDHGEYLGDHGLLHKGPASYRQLTEVPMLMSGPGIQPGQIIESLTSHIDFVPTLLAMSATEAGGSLDGGSLEPVLAGEQAAVRELAFGEFHPSVRPELYDQTVHSDRWRFTIYPDMPEWGELFDLDADPGERANLFFDDASQDVKAELGQALADQFPPQPVVDNPVLCKW